MSDYISVNRAFWDELAERHVESDFYATARFRNGENILDPLVRERIGHVDGKRLLHLQCHFGLDTLSLARMGAEVTGLDFSPVALEAARTLSRECGVPATFVQSDILKAPETLTGFDIVFASWGATPWIGDMTRWMQVAGHALKPGGRLFLAEGHPMMMTIDEAVAADAPFRVRYDYDSRTPLELEHQQDYAGPGILKAHRNVQFLHGMATILNAALAAGFFIARIEELDRIPWEALPQLVRADDEYWKLPDGAPQIPLALVLHAIKK
jgi:SAM-dependent methyltransferase